MSAPVIRCKRLTKRFGDVVAVDAVDLDIWHGEIVAALGESGCGKTTLLRLIAGFETPTDGRVEILGEEVSSADYVLPPERRGLGMVVQDYALFPHMTIEANVAFGLKSLDSAARAARVDEALSLVGLERLARRYPFELSGGQQQRVALARTLAPKPAATLLDEPFSNLDSSMRQRLRLEVEDILRSQRTSTIFVTHNREEAFAIADRVGVMADGRLEQVDTPERVYHFPASPQVARMTGACDFIDGSLRRDGGVDTELGTLAGVSPGESCQPGGAVSALIHPEDLELIPDSDGQGIVSAREFRGEQVILSVKLNSGSTVRASRRSHSTLPAGSRVRVCVARAAAFPIYPAAGE